MEICGIGNPLLDLLVKVEPGKFMALLFPFWPKLVLPKHS